MRHAAAIFAALLVLAACGDDEPALGDGAPEAGDLPSCGEV